jgi:hypothetical protein
MEAWYQFLAPTLSSLFLLLFSLLHHIDRTPTISSILLPSSSPLPFSSILLIPAPHRPDGSVVPVPGANIHIPTPQIGDIVSFYYDSHPRDVPLHPQVYRARPDISWNEVVQSSVSEEKFVNGMKREKGREGEKDERWKGENEGEGGDIPLRSP